MENEAIVAATVFPPASEVPAQLISSQTASTEVAMVDNTSLISPWDEPAQEEAATNIAEADTSVAENSANTAALPMLLLAIFALVMLWATAQVLIMTAKAVVTLLLWLVQKLEEKQESWSLRLKKKQSQLPQQL